MQCARVEQGEARQVVQALRFLHPSSAQAQEKLQELIGYLENNLDRMHYAHIIFVSMATTPSSSRMPSSYFGAATSMRSLKTSRQAAHPIASPRAIL